MTLYVIKHDDEDYRLHRQDGTEIGSPDWDEHPTAMMMVEALAEEHSGASILGNADARWEYTQVVTNEVRYKDLTIDGETVPW